MKKYATFAKRSWCIENRDTILYLQRKFPELKMERTRFWEYSWAWKQLKNSCKNSFIVDIGAGDCKFSSMLKEHGFNNITIIDNYLEGWQQDKSKNLLNRFNFIDSDCRDLKEVKSNSFDIVLLISVIEHIPSNMIYCELRKEIKIARYVKEDNYDKRMVLNEAERIVKNNGKIIITSDIYIDYPDDMNISWRELLDIEGIDRRDISDISDLYYYDNPIHKGRVLPIGIIIEKC